MLDTLYFDRKARQRESRLYDSVVGYCTEYVFVGGGDVGDPEGDAPLEFHCTYQYLHPKSPTTCFEVDFPVFTDKYETETVGATTNMLVLSAAPQRCKLQLEEKDAFECGPRFQAFFGAIYGLGMSFFAAHIINLFIPEISAFGSFGSQFVATGFVVYLSILLLVFIVKWLSLLSCGYYWNLPTHPWSRRRTKTARVAAPGEVVAPLLEELKKRGPAEDISETDLLSSSSGRDEGEAESTVSC